MINFILAIVMFWQGMPGPVPPAGWYTINGVNGTVTVTDDAVIMYPTNKQPLKVDKGTCFYSSNTLFWIAEKATAQTVLLHSNNNVRQKIIVPAGTPPNTSNAVDGQAHPCAVK